MTDFYDQASEHEEKYRELAIAHARKPIKNSIRSDSVIIALNIPAQACYFVTLNVQLDTKRKRMHG